MLREGSRERSLNTAAYEGSPNAFRRNNGRDVGKHRGNGTSITNSPREVTTISAVTHRGTRTATCQRIAIHAGRKKHANVGTATLQAEEDDGVIATTERATTANAITVGTPLSTAGITACFACRTEKVARHVPCYVESAHESVPKRNLFNLRGAPKLRQIREQTI